MSNLEQLREEIARLKEELAKSREAELIKNAKPVGSGLSIISENLPGADPEELREVASHLIEKHPDIVVTLGTSDSNRAYICDASGSHSMEMGINANIIVKEMCKEIGGSGGGSSQLAQGGGPDVEKLEQAMKKGLELIKKQLR